MGKEGLIGRKVIRESRSDYHQATLEWMYTPHKILQRAAKTITSNDQTYLFWTTLIYYVISVLSPNNKAIFLSLLALWFIYNRRFRNIRFSLLLTAIASLIFLVGKTWTFQLISPILLKSTSYPQGYMAISTITPFNILAFMILAVLMRDLLKDDFGIRRKIINTLKKKWMLYLSLFFLWQVVSALSAKNVYNLSIMYTLQSLSFLVLLLGLRAYDARNGRQYVRITSIFAAITMFEAILASFQWIYRSTFGLAIESTQGFLTYQRAVDQSFFSVRSLGTFSHPNELAVFALLMIPIFLSLLYGRSQGKHKLKQIYYWVAFLSAATLVVLSQGRSAWISSYIALLGFLYIVEKRWDRHLIAVKDITTRKVFYLTLVAIVGLTVIVPRAGKSIDLFKPSGGVETRSKLVKESINLIRENPIFGVGMGLSPYAMLRMNPRGIVSIFPSVVHNFYLLTASESGLPALLFFLMFIISLFKDMYQQWRIFPQDDKIRKLGLLAALVSVLINSVTQQIFLMGFFLIVCNLLTTNERNQAREKIH